MTIEANTIQPLVSICVITYNSAEYIVETLESIKGQTYQNIELVISDDFSTDNTIRICREWVKDNKDRFVECYIDEALQNRGVSANCNKGLSHCKGIWLKLIAGDDLLLPDCIASNMDFAHNNTDASFIGSIHVPFYEVEGRYFENIGDDDKYRQNILKYISTLDVEHQYKEILKKDSIYTTTLFYSKELFNRVKFNEKYKTLEDYPFKLDVLKSGFKYYHFDKVTVRYRNHFGSISGLKNGKIFTSQYKTNHQFDLDYRYKELGWEYWMPLSYNYYVKCIYDKFGLNRNNIICLMLYKLLTGGILHAIKRLYQYVLVKIGFSKKETKIYFKYRRINN